MELTYGVRPAVATYVFRPKRGQSYRYEKTCPACGRSFVAARPQCQACSVACRKRLSRVNIAKKAAAKAAAKKKREMKKKPPAKKRGVRKPVKQ